MSACLIALVILAFMSVFSAKYRRWAREAFNCVARRVTLRPCNTTFNQKVKAKVTSRLMRRSMRFARFTYRHFEGISWVFTIVMFVSLAYTAYGFYNLAVLGTCDPITGDCIFNPGGNPNRVLCPFHDLEPHESVPTIGGFMDIESASIDGRPKVYFIGTTWCPHCAWERPLFINVTSMFSDHADIKVIEIDQDYTEGEMEMFNHYSPEGSIPVVILGGKYFRIGSGEDLGEDGERQALTAIMCKITGDPIDICHSPDVSGLTAKL
ncbi:MAG: hypothetical protein DRO99_03035 [Candidatus Aenigmatarchaeota archaeon]|nr:MAG: hypothetical protein DRO99_03035 [Candidatus Aenigmarchaeota archaeon]